MPTMTMTINLRKKLIRLHTARRRKRAASLIKEAVARFSKTDVEKIRINPKLNEFIEKNASGASFMWARMKVNVEKGTDTAEVKLYAPKVAAPAAAAGAKPAAQAAPAAQKPAAAAPPKAEPKSEKKA